MASPESGERKPAVAQQVARAFERSPPRIQRAEQPGQRAEQPGQRPQLLERLAAGDGDPVDVVRARVAPDDDLGDVHVPAPAGSQVSRDTQPRQPMPQPWNHSPAGARNPAWCRESAPC